MKLIDSPPFFFDLRSASKMPESRRDSSVSRRVSILHALRTNPSLLPSRGETRTEKAPARNVDEEGPRCRVAIRAPYGSPNHLESSPLDSTDKIVSESYTDSPRRLRPPVASSRKGATTVVDKASPQHSSAVHIAWHNTSSSEAEKSTRPTVHRASQRC
eukprot:TRINITY_DN473_c0_g1_i2.p1 TRINITY_DN473_c0_g1~~TRINITY_DN473_c0_g1_i2.p1  ORF type:complete len:159 (+),score=16.02 TRINITY_DN473_c0_g1_i2:744-1220(+)